MTFTTATEQFQSGSINIQFYLPDTASITRTVYINSLSSLVYEMDVPNSTEDPKSIGSKPGSIKVKLMQTVRDDQLAEAFDKIQQGQSFLAKLTFSQTPVVDSIGVMNFYVDRSSFSYDEKTKLIEVTLVPIPLVYVNIANNGTLVNYSVINLVTDSSVSWTNTNNSAKYLPAQTFINEALRLITTQSSQEFVENVFETAYTNGSLNWFVGNNGSVSIGDAVGILASVTGCLYGDFFGGTFFVARNESEAGLLIELSKNDIIEIERRRFYETEYKATTVDFGSDSGSSIATIPYGEKTLEVNFLNNFAVKGNVIDSVARTFNDVSSTGLNPTTGAALGYAHALGVTGGQRIDLKILGFKNIKPYSIIVFDTDVPLVYRGTATSALYPDGYLYRISKIEYDFVNYTTNMEIYQIAFA